jgi:hypothetical protein
MGPRFRNRPPVFEQAAVDLADEIVAWGEQPSRNYRDWLGRDEWVVSTALHEFQGVAVMEAVKAGCIPAVPDRLGYPDFSPQRRRGRRGLILERAFEPQRRQEHKVFSKRYGTRRFHLSGEELRTCKPPISWRPLRLGGSIVGARRL